MAAFDIEELMGQLYVDNLRLKAEVKLLRDILIANASSDGKQSVGKGLLALYYEKIESYYEDQLLHSHLKDEYLQKQAEDFLKRMKEELKRGDQGE